MARQKKETFRKLIGSIWDDSSCPMCLDSDLGRFIMKEIHSEDIREMDRVVPLCKDVTVYYTRVSITGSDGGKKPVHMITMDYYGEFIELDPADIEYMRHLTRMYNRGVFLGEKSDMKERKRYMEQINVRYHWDCE